MKNNKNDKASSMEDILQVAEESIKQIIESGIPEEVIIEQIQRFKKGFPHTRIIRPCTPNDGIVIIQKKDRARLINKYTQAAATGRVTKFVPASGAATRMFKSLLSVYSRSESKSFEISKDDEDYRAVLVFINSLHKFAFYDKLKNLMRNDRLDLDELCEKIDYQTILNYTLTSKGLNYANLPKGLIPFHSYSDHVRTPFAEHIAESVEYTQTKDGKVSLHFTVSPQHREDIERHVSSELEHYPSIDFDISYSEQRKQTNTIAVDLSDKGFRTQEGHILFRPAGHGALIINLNDQQKDLIFLKNIDNVAPDRLKSETFENKKVLGGFLIELQDQIFKYVRILKEELPNLETLTSISNFAISNLGMIMPDNYKNLTIKEKADWLLLKLNRPIRVCGMVKNLGESGGGPFWVKGADGLPAQQIVEKSQVDLNDTDQVSCLTSATHFNPVDIICGVRDYENKPFDLLKSIDTNTGFISVKSKEGEELKAMELPGLWNGSMADWITIFIEVPLSTFSPVKTVNDLLKEEHQP
ncbi:DUF4301 family protein [Maridesulfovibrio ferrireducens]|uniref:DUF4301 family protein n=1 Tax=Maridesulfovibrio ferrireducens TaxID=246191 RepID=UPI001A2D9EF7|nr:DUF4301 family protein [Maridesulfovibrio ferrireducens]MBI9113081.1 DUF4301 family protein [Maridesulfovibrio ferrireducens]